MSVRVLVFLHKLHIEELAHIGCDHLEVSLREGLAETYALTAVEWEPARRLTLVPGRSQVKWMFWVKPVRLELIGFLPLGRVHAKAIEEDHHNLASLDVVLADPAVLT